MALKRLSNRAHDMSKNIFQPILVSVFRNFDLRPNQDVNGGDTGFSEDFVRFLVKSQYIGIHSCKNALKICVSPKGRTQPVEPGQDLCDFAVRRDKFPKSRGKIRCYLRV